MPDFVRNVSKTSHVSYVRMVCFQQKGSNQLRHRDSVYISQNIANGRPGKCDREYLMSAPLGGKCRTYRWSTNIKCAGANCRWWMLPLRDISPSPEGDQLIFLAIFCTRARALSSLR